MSAICGGVVSESMHRKNMKKDIWADMMGFVMADKHYKKFIQCKKSGKEKESKKLFDRYAISQI